MSLLLTTTPNRSTVSLGQKLRFKDEDEEKITQASPKPVEHSTAWLSFVFITFWVGYLGKSSKLKQV